MREESRVRSVHHPVTPRTGFFPSGTQGGFRVGKREGGRRGSAGRKVGFSDDVVVHVLVAEEEEAMAAKEAETEDVEMKDL